MTRFGRGVAVLALFVAAQSAVACSDPDEPGLDAAPTDSGNADDAGGSDVGDPMDGAGTDGAQIDAALVDAQEDAGGSGLAGASGPLLAVPGAFGGGKETTGGRGHEVVIVDTTSMAIDAGDGVTSFAEAVSEDDRTIVFNVSGVIGDGGTFDLAHSNLTIACHTAPGRGVAFRFGRFVLNGRAASNIIMRHCRFRATDPADFGGSSDNGRGFMVGYGASDLYIDHMSESWGTDANVQIYMASNGQPQVENVSIVNSMIVEGDGDSQHSQSERFEFYHSMGASCLNGDAAGLRPERITYANNFLAHNAGRNFAANSCEIEVRNNIVYNWGYTTTMYTNTVTTDVVVQNNLYVAGPNSSGAGVPECGAVDYKCPFAVYSDALNSNVGNNWWADLDPRAAVLMEPLPFGQQSPPTFEWGAESPVLVTTMAAQDGEHIRCLGASVPTRDGVDERVLGEFYSGAGRVGIAADGTRDYSFYTMDQRPTEYDSDADGMADAWEESVGLVVGERDHAGDADADGWTNIEEFFADVDRGCR